MSSQWIHILQGNIFLLVLWRQVILDLMFLTFSLISFSHRKIKSKVPFFFLTPFSRNLQKFIYVDSGRGSDQISPDRPIRSVLGWANPIPPCIPILGLDLQDWSGLPFNQLGLDRDRPVEPTWIGLGPADLILIPNPSLIWTCHSCYLWHFFFSILFTLYSSSVQFLWVITDHM